jgi:hypothetical protein
MVLRPSFGGFPRPAPIVIRAPRAASKPKAKRRHKGASAGPDPVKLAGAAFLYGVAKKQGLIDKLPTIPMLGRTGTVAVGAWYWSKHGGGPIVRQIAIVAAILAGAQLGEGGSIAGDDTEGDGHVVTTGDDEY